MDVEMSCLQKLGTFKIVDRPTDQKVIDSRWVFARKEKSPKEVQYKARVVAKGCQQKFGIDYHDTWAPTARPQTLRMVMALSAQENCTLAHVDVKTAFPNAILHDRVYMKPPPGFETAGKVWLLLKALYGLKQAGREWYMELRQTMMEMKFSASNLDPCLYYKHSQGSTVLVVVHVDDCIISYKHRSELDFFLAGMTAKYEISYLGNVTSALGIEFAKVKWQAMLDAEKLHRCSPNQIWVCRCSRLPHSMLGE